MTRDPRSYARAIEHQASRAESPIIRQTGRPVVAMLSGALGLTDHTAAPPVVTGRCEYCCERKTVYAYALWVCADCLRADPARSNQ